MGTTRSNRRMDDSFSLRLSQAIRSKAATAPASATSSVAVSRRAENGDSFGTRLRQVRAGKASVAATTAEQQASPASSQDSFSAKLSKLLGADDGVAASSNGSAAKLISTPASGVKTGRLRDAPTGAGDYIVRQGDCVSSIAVEQGHTWDTIWNEPANKQLRAVRKDPNVLLPRDRLTIPPIEPKSEPGQTEMRHRFVRKGQPAELNLRVLDRNKPLSNQPYTLTVDGREYSGTTDTDGKLRCGISPSGRRGVLRVGEGSRAVEYALDLGNLDPSDTLRGAQGRLKNLGFYRGEATGQSDQPFKEALRRFQRSQGLEATGELNESSRRALKRVHGS